MADLLPHGLEAQPPGFGETGLLERVLGHRVVDLLRRSCCHGQQLCLTGALHREEPEACFVDRLADGEQTMVLMDGCLAGRERGGQLLAGLEVEYDCATLLGDDPVVAVEDARILGDGIERDAQRGERLAVHAVAVRRGDDVRSAWCIAEWMTNAARFTGRLP